MNNIFFCLLIFLSVFANAQTQQNINKNTGTTSNPITTIDSIRFNGSSTIMEVVLQNGTTDSHSISEIISIYKKYGTDLIQTHSLDLSTSVDKDLDTLLVSSVYDIDFFKLNWNSLDNWLLNL